MTTTISPSLGHAPAFTQQGVGATPGYDAIDRRRANSTPATEGVGLSSGAWMVVQRAAGATMSVDIGANVEHAWVQGDSVSFQGLYTVPPHSAVINEAIATAHASLPRVDAVILEVQDHIHDASGGNLARVRVVAGTATSGATLDNARDGSHGGGAIPSNALHLADVLVAGGATSITNAAIRDRRRWAFGAYSRIVRATSDYVASSTTYDLIDSTNLYPRIECSGLPLRVALTGMLTSLAGSVFGWVPVIDGAGVNGMAAAGAAGSFANGMWWEQSANTERVRNVEYTFTPSAGSHRIGPAVAGPASSRTWRANSTMPLIWTVEEVVRQNAANNTTTSG